MWTPKLDLKKIPIPQFELKAEHFKELKSFYDPGKPNDESKIEFRFKDSRTSLEGMAQVCSAISKELSTRCGCSSAVFFEGGCFSKVNGYHSESFSLAFDNARYSGFMEYFKIKPLWIVNENSLKRVFISDCHEIVSEILIHLIGDSEVKSVLRKLTFNFVHSKSWISQTTHVTRDVGRIPVFDVRWL